MSDECRRKALETAADVLQYQQRSAAALYDRLIEKDVAPEDAAYAVARMQELGYLDDAAYAAMVCRDLAARGYGKRRARAALRDKKVSPEVIDAALEDFQTDTDRVRAYINAKLGSGEPDRRAVKRVTDGLFRRGFSWEEIQTALQEYLENETDE